MAPATLTLAMLMVLPACRGEEAADGVRDGRPQQGTDVRDLPDIDAHFSGSELALARAAAKGDHDEVARLIAGGADPNAISPGGLPLLAWPVLQGSVAGVQALLDGGADPNRAAPAVGTVMGWAVRAENPAILQAFLDRGGDAGARNPDGVPLTKVAALAGRWRNVQSLIEHGADLDAHPPGLPGDTVLGYYSAGQFDKAHWLLERGADPGYRIESAPVAERIGKQPIVENIYWWPVNAGKFPQLAQWQQRCQDLLAARGHAAPVEPPHLQRLRASQQASRGTPGMEPRPDPDAEIAEREAELRARLRGD